MSVCHDAGANATAKRQWEKDQTEKKQAEKKQQSRKRKREEDCHNKQEQAWKEEADTKEFTDAHLKQWKNRMRHKKCSYAQFKDAVKEIMEWCINHCPDVILTMHGLERVETKEGQKRLTDKCTRTKVSHFFIEHIACKPFMGVSRTRGGRAADPPAPWRHHRWPTVSDGLAPKEHETIAKEAYEAWQEDCKAKNRELPQMHNVFRLQAELEEEDNGTN